MPIPRPGSTLPAAAPPLVSAPSEARRPRRLDLRRLRRSLSASLAEGMVAETVNAFAGGAVLTGWALYLRFDTFMIGVLGALPIVAQIFHLPAAWLTEALGRRRLAAGAAAASRLLYAALALIILLDLPLAPARAVLLGVAGGASILAVIGNNAWVSWMGDLVPAGIRGRFFGRRMAAATFAGTVAALGAGYALDHFRPLGHQGAVLAALSILAALAGLAGWWLMLRQHDPGGEPRTARFDAAAILGVFRDPGARRFLTYQVAWNGAVGLAASFFALHMLQNLEMGFTLCAAYGAGVALARILSAPLWGRAIDRFGARPVLALCSMGIAAVPAMWLWPTRDFLWPLALEGVLAGVLWGGQGLAAFDLPLAVSPRARRAYYLGVFASAGGLAFAAASVAGGLLARVLPEQLTVAGRPFVDLQVLFALSAVTRLGAGALALRIVQPGARPVGALLGSLLRPSRRALPALERP